MTTYEMLRTLRDHHITARKGIVLVRSHCDRNCVDGAGLSAARAHLIASSRARSAFVSNVIVPKLLSLDGEVPRDELSSLLCSCAAHRMVSDAHIEHWTEQAIALDPEGYCAAARKIWAMMEGQIELEQQVLIRPLEEVRDAVSADGTSCGD